MSDTNTAINTVSVDCPAKTNLTLHVGRPRSEWGGRHELDTIYCAVGVYDTVTTSRKKPGSGFSLNLEGAYLGDLASSGSDMRRNHAVLALFAKALPGSIRAFLMTLATVDDLLAIILIAVFFSSINAWYWFIGIAVCAAIWAYLVRLKKSAVDRGWHRRYPRLDHDVRGRRAPHTGRRAGWPADPLS